MKKHCRLGINIDHIATLRNARGENHPNLLRAAKVVKKCKVDSITMHLREDRRHIVDEDLFLLKKNVKIPINLEIAPTFEMINIALALKPHSICFVPENREELTTEGGLDVKKNFSIINELISFLKNSKIKIACFIDSEKKQIDCLKKLNVKCLEINTGKYALENNVIKKRKIIDKIKNSIKYANNLGMSCHAGHGLNFKNVGLIASLTEIEELNIGQFLIGESIFNGLENSILEMKKIIKESRL